jgi:ATP-GRASP peptide maturase of grasp-with-spasm system
MPWLETFDKNLPFNISYGTVTNIAKELAAVRELLFHRLKDKMKLTNSRQLSVNKLVVFEKASKAGFNVPDYLITNNKEDLKAFYNKHDKIVCKDIDTPLVIQSFQEQALSYVELIEEKFINDLPEMFMLSLFQAYIEKEIEIRAFVLDKEIYSMAIFSQGDAKTAVDFRKYNTMQPNRNVPYKLPEKIECQIIELMSRLDLITGSVDLIKNTSGDYTFLEVNPVGQFGMVSYPCNYNLEQKVAKFLYA